MKVSPCKDCPNKGCGSYHDQCEAYLEWSKENKRIKAEIQAQKNEDGRFIHRKRL